MRLRIGLLLLLLAPTALQAASLDVSIDGVTGNVLQNVQASLSIYQEREHKDLADARIRRLHALAPEEIRSALKPFGYYRPRIDDKLDFDRNEDRWLAHYVVETGPAIPVRNVQVNLTGQGASDSAFRALVDRFPIKRGDALNQAIYDQAKQRFQTLAAERGYFDLRFTRHEIRMDLEAYYAEITLDIDTGMRYRFGEITIDQNLLTPELIQRYVRIQPGDYYSTQALLDAQNALATSNYFGDVQVNADSQHATDHVVPLIVRLKTRPQNKYTIGAGYGTDTGPRGQLGWERYYLNPEGHHTRVELHSSQISRSLTVGYFIPIRNPRTDQLGLTGGFEETDTATASSNIRRLAVSRTNARGYLLETLSLTHQHEEYAIGDQSGISSLLMPGINWTYYWGDERIYVRRGARALLDVRGAWDKIASDTSLTQVRFQVKAIWPVASFGRLITRADIGRTGIDNFIELPASLRFFAGGDTSVRGYDYNNLGPVDAKGNVVGGPNLLVGSVEYEQHIAGNWSAAVFFDEGNALIDFNDPLKKGAGVGVRWRTPIGQIRVDIAAALSEPGHPRRLHISIGPDL